MIHVIDMITIYPRVITIYPGMITIYLLMLILIRLLFTLGIKALLDLLLFQEDAKLTLRLI